MRKGATVSSQGLSNLGDWHLMIILVLINRRSFSSHNFVKHDIHIKPKSHKHELLGELVV